MLPDILALSFIFALIANDRVHLCRSRVQLGTKSVLAHAAGGYVQFQGTRTHVSGVFLSRDLTI
jgi:hypothetical protein